MALVNDYCFPNWECRGLSGKDDAAYSSAYNGQSVWCWCMNLKSHGRMTKRLRLRPQANAKKKMVSNGYVGSSGSSLSSVSTIPKGRIYRRMDSCLVIPPPNGKKPRAIIKFLGGFLIISVPYNVSFDHAEVAQEVHEKFNSCLGRILASGLPDSNLTVDNLIDLPLYSVGHSNGALVQALVGSYFSDGIPKANAIISFNNRPATEAVPYFEQLGPLVRQMMPIVEASPMYSLVRNASEDAWKMMRDTAAPMMTGYDEEALVSVSTFVDQLPFVFNQVAQGVSEFRPTPSENRDFFKNSYNVKHTLLVKFGFDAIDETDLLEETLRPRVESIGGTLEKISLNGTHITPCIQEPKWQVGNAYTPADAIAQGLKTLSLADTRVLSRTITSWFKRIEAYANTSSSKRQRQ
ncbi:Protein of unknown function DUF1350 [Dillenia turbinata]|uniref:Uncharacterized protein n=1 Tax=Dillenia turbinata TaxID=194707 RepID=A0AAN8UQY3_9MAGN